MAWFKECRILSAGLAKMTKLLRHIDLRASLGVYRALEGFGFRVLSSCVQGVGVSIERLGALVT